MACAVIRARAHDARAASVSYPTSNVALIFAKFCLDNKTSIFNNTVFLARVSSARFAPGQAKRPHKAAVRIDNNAGASV